jgi:hypothetical protein
MTDLKLLARAWGLVLIVLGIFGAVTIAVEFAGLSAVGLLLATLGAWLIGRGGRQDPVKSARTGWGRSVKTEPPRAPAPQPAAEKPPAVKDPEPPAPQPPKKRVWGRDSGPGWLKHMPRAKHFFRIPGFRQFKRVAAFVCMLVNFFMGEFALTAPGSQLFSVFFLVTSFLLADYLWKTQKKAAEE